MKPQTFVRVGRLLPREWSCNDAAAMLRRLRHSGPVDLYPLPNGRAYQARTMPDALYVIAVQS